MAEAENFSFADLNAWKTNCKAKSFDFALKETSGKSDVVKIGMPFDSINQAKKDDLWASK